MGYNPYSHWLDKLDEELDKIVEMHYDFKTGEIVPDEALPDLEPETFEKQTYRYRILDESGVESKSREIEADGDSQALRRVFVQVYPGETPPSDKKACLEALVSIRMNNEEAPEEEKMPVVLWVHNMNNSQYVYDTEGKHYFKATQNRPDF